MTVEIEDNGPGFPVDQVGSFSDIMSLRSGNYGLFQCKSIIDRHNGEIELLQKPNGAAIKFSLPVK